MNVEWRGGEQSSPPADYKSALLDCRVQVGACIRVSQTFLESLCLGLRVRKLGCGCGACHR